MTRLYLLLYLALLMIAVTVESAAQPAIPTSPPMEIHSKHWIFGYPLGTPLTNDLIIRDVYALSSNDTTKFADWVAYQLTPHEVVGTLDLLREWRADPWLSENETLEPKPDSEDDYRGANASPHNYDRGHQAPLGSFKGSKYASQTNFLSNITPQKIDLNRGPWKKLEGKVRELVKKGNTVWVVTGPLYESDMVELPNVHNDTHKIPSGYWKIVAIRDGESLRVVAFIMNQSTARTSPLKDHIKTVKEVEDKSKLNFFWELPDSDETELETKKDADFIKSWLGIDITDGQ